MNEETIITVGDTTYHYSKKDWLKSMLFYAKLENNHAEIARYEGELEILKIEEKLK